MPTTRLPPAPNNRSGSGNECAGIWTVERRWSNSLHSSPHKREERFFTIEEIRVTESFLMMDVLIWDYFRCGARRAREAYFTVRRASRRRDKSKRGQMRTSTRDNVSLPALEPAVRHDFLSRLTINCLKPLGKKGERDSVAPSLSDHIGGWWSDTHRTFRPRRRQEPTWAKIKKIAVGQMRKS